MFVSRFVVIAVALVTLLTLAAGGPLDPTRIVSWSGSSPAPAAFEPAVASAQVIPVSSTTGLIVVGEGVVYGEPDLAYITTGVLTRRPSAREAQDENNGTMQAVIARIQALGIADADVRTSGITLFPVNDPQTNQLVAYEATNQLRVTVRDIHRVGEVLDAAVAAGANQTGDVRFAFRDDTSLRHQALDQAIRAARSTADSIAASAGVRIVSMQSLIDESPTGQVLAEMAPRPAQVQAPLDVPVQPGRLVVTGRVRIVYQIQ